MLFVGVFSTPVFAGHNDEQIKQLKEEILKLNKSIRKLADERMKIKKENPDSFDITELDERMERLNLRKAELMARLEELKLSNN